MVLNNLFPIFALIAMGAALRHWGLTSPAFLRTSDRLVYYIFFPAMLFWKIGGARYGPEFDTGLLAAALATLALVYTVSCLCIALGPISAFQAGSFSQGCYRFNTYIGMAIIITTMGESGVRDFGILIGVVIPVINVLAVSTLIWFSGRQLSLAGRAAMTLRALVSNPLIIACLAGIAYARLVNAFPVFVDNTLRLMSSITLPLALLSIGGALSFQGLRQGFGAGMIATGLKLVLFPLAGYHFLGFFGVTGMPFQVGMLFFALPASPAIYVLSSQLNSDTQLASAIIVISTMFSFFSLSLVLTRFF
jgi:malonate transporter and related proteins